MADAANKYTQNVTGAYYVDDQCIDCDLCRETAPANFKRDDDGSYVDVEMPRSEFAALRQRLSLSSGSRVHLRARRITRFSADRGVQHDLPDPAAMI